MKKYQKFLFIMLLCSAGLFASAAYLFHRNAGFRDIGEPAASFLIPDDRLRRMTDDALIQTVLKNPHMGEIWLDNSLQEGFEIEFQQYKIYSELFSRKGVPQRLMQYYMDCEIITEQDKYHLALPDALLEILLTQEIIRNQFSEEERRELDDRIYQSYCTRLQYPEIFGGKDISPAYHCQRVLMEELFLWGKDTQTVQHPYAFVMEHSKLDFGANRRSYPALSIAVH